MERSRFLGDLSHRLLDRQQRIELLAQRQPTTLFERDASMRSDVSSAFKTLQAQSTLLNLLRIGCLIERVHSPLELAQHQRKLLKRR